MNNGSVLLPRTAARLAAGGFAAGVINGIFGNGAGIPLVFLLGSDAMRGILEGRREVFANVTAAVLPMSVVSALIYSSFSPPDVWEAVSVSAAALAGGMLGALLLGKIEPRVLKKIFATVMTVSGGVMLFLK